ncbi:MAG TPA: hypothetical protein VMG12_27190, partial [Polyangiaceae bacterium]|nr:hypothetical protein [Polyangiaceae bacterium]
MSESKMQNKATGSFFVSGAGCDTTDFAAATAVEHGPIDGQSLDLARASKRGARRAFSWRQFARRSLLSLSGGITSMLLASSALAQQADPAPEEPAADPAPAEAAPAEAAP